jgi:hypothetical protein
VIKRKLNTIPAEFTELATKHGYIGKA